MRAAGLLVLVLMAGCRSEPSFEQRYQSGAENLAERANAMEAELDARLEAANAAMGNVAVEAR